MLMIRMFRERGRSQQITMPRTRHIRRIQGYLGRQYGTRQANACHLHLDNVC